MQKIMQQIKENKKIHYIFIIIIGTLLSLGLFNIQIRDTHDGFLHLTRLIKTDEMLKFAANMEFEKAAELRDQIKELENSL